MPTKPKKPQKETPTVPQERDNFLTPNYATDLLAPYLTQFNLDYSQCIWECCAGNVNLIGKRLSSKYNFPVTITSIETGHNFLTCDVPECASIIVTNPPFSLKKKMIYRAIELDLPFAFLIPPDYCGWINDVIRNYGCEKIVPTRRIDYLTPNTVKRVVEGETFRYICEEHDISETIKKYNDLPIELKNAHEDYYHNLQIKYQSIYDIPNKLLAKYSTSQFHSAWLTRKFNLGKTETFVDLSKEEKENIL